jgi:hypothetical protein
MMRKHSALGIVKLLKLFLLLQTTIVCSLTFDQPTRRDWFRATAGAILSSNLLLSDAANAAEDAMEEAGGHTTTKPYLMKEYYNNKPTTMPSKGRYLFPALTPPFNNRATYRYEVSLLTSDMPKYFSLRSPKRLVDKY